MDGKVVGNERIEEKMQECPLVESIILNPSLGNMRTPLA